MATLTVTKHTWPRAFSSLVNPVVFHQCCASAVTTVVMNVFMRATIQTLEALYDWWRLTGSWREQFTEATTVEEKMMRSWAQMMKLQISVAIYNISQMCSNLLLMKHISWFWLDVNGVKTSQDTNYHAEL